MLSSFSSSGPLGKASRSLLVRPLVGLLAIAVLSGVAGSARAAPEGQLTWAVHVTLAPTWFDPAETSGIITPYMVLYAIHDAMVKPMPGNSLAPSLAETVTVSDDKLTYAMTIRQGAKFHDGTPVTAEDVKFSFERYRGAQAAQIKGRVASIETPDARHVRFKLQSPWPDFLTFYASATGAGWVVPNGAAPGTLQTRYWKDFHPAQINGQPGAEPVPEVATASGLQALALRVYVGPKDYDVLKHMNPPLHGLVNFGWMEFIADPLFHALKWLHKYIPNWGWAIVILTLVINMALFPLRISSYKTTMKMQRVGPEIKAIQERYKKYKLNDPRKAEMNKEVMAVYSREGINPAGGCFQMFLQMPIWFGLNNALRFAIEMRHARWFGWITDLSARDPYYVLPVMMGLSMYLVSKMTPMTSTDPQQQMMMKIMPITMAGIFIISPISSGLAVYILTSSLVGILQQWWLNKQHPVTAVVPAGKGGKNKK